MTRAVDIRPDHLEIVQGNLREHLPVDVTGLGVREPRQLDQEGLLRPETRLGV